VGAGRFVLEFPTANLRGATYNPRAIAPDSLEVLGRSIEQVGFAKPIIVTESGLIIAGHQRTKAARALGLVSVPAYLLSEINKYDEVKFNQLHNGTDLDIIDKPVTVPVNFDKLGFEEILPVDITADMRSQGANIRNEINGLLLRHGNWGCAIVTQAGDVISSPQYLLSCKSLKMPARVYRIPDETAQTAAGFFSRQYGRFSYEHLDRTTWIQTFAQPFRLRNGKVSDLQSESNGASVLYRVAMPWLRKPGMRILDFGCGQGDLVKALQREGMDIRGVEFFRRSGNMLDTGAVHRMCDALVRQLKTHGLFDIVVCDSVINSVDSLQAEVDVMVCLNAFCKPGGMIFFSGRRTENLDQHMRTTKTSLPNARTVEFLDDNGFSGIYYEGTWFYQKFHTEAQATALGRKYLGNGKYIDHSNSWQFATIKQVVIQDGVTPGAKDGEPDVLQGYAPSILREFNLPWPDGNSVGKGEVVLEAWLEAVAMKQFVEPPAEVTPVLEHLTLSEADIANEETELEAVARVQREGKAAKKPRKARAAKG
jgi:ParB family chromosome partitioning protein